MLPKASFTDIIEKDDGEDSTGTKMLSRIGKLTSCNYPIFYMADPVSQHARFIANSEKNQALILEDPNKKVKESEAG